MTATVIRGMKDEDYYVKSDGRLTATMVKMAATKNLYAVYQYLTDQEEPTESMRISWLCHLKALEPEVWDSKVVHPPSSILEGITTANGKPATKPKSTAEYKTRLQEWEFQQGDKITVTEKEYYDVTEIVAAYQDSECHKLPTETEVAILYEFEGVPMKSKLDAVVDYGFGLDVLDLKFLRTTKGLVRSVFKYGYHIQMALYREAAIAAGLSPDRMVITGIDKTTREARDVICSPMSEEALELGREEAAYWVRRIKHCMKTGVWPGNEAPAEITVPDWYRPSFLFDQAIDD